MRQIVLDTETTGLSPANGDRIIEIGCIELLGRKPSGNNRHYYLNPEREIHAEAQRVHGLSLEFLADKPKFAQVAADLLDYLAGAELIIHNAPFDIGFLDAEWQRLGHGPTRQLAGGVIDTLLMAKEMYPGKRNGLDALCERLGVDNSSRTRHGALLDAELLAEVYICLTRGQDSLLMELDIGPSGSGHSDGSSLGLGQGQSASASDWSHLAIPLLQANPQERQAHEALLLELDQASKGKTLWRKLQPMPA
ncbi:DNA polymerase III, epsilon subunit and related 3'-5' exonuclease [Serpentinimonas raichei]|jgi:DNA polymerase-3 subunit epsilon|uniref:DNA polymerase III subunit epsilon n=1 Tax=Serpentinimonas raichei TaxID=1458425 RepID=A0A060NND3_9BURK|nr:DNA polymerase III subunit epsilon [Serpentinimonas raichei]BAO80414.1 DNA polymerase III, epsilon subunit and related 3'-5' exonuclease [Serpentinimonas raichei]